MSLVAINSHDLVHACIWRDWGTISGISKGIEIMSLHSLVDLLPTFLDLAGATVPEGHTVDGHSLVPLLQHGDAAAGGYPDSVISQFHGENLVMSWCESSSSSGYYPHPSGCRC